MENTEETIEEVEAPKCPICGEDLIIVSRCCTCISCGWGLCG